MNRETWNRDALTAHQIVDQLRIDFENNPRVETWAQLLDAYRDRIRNANVSDSSMEILLYISTIGHTLFSNMPAVESWRDIVMFINSSIDLVTKTMDT